MGGTAGERAWEGASVAILASLTVAGCQPGDGTHEQDSRAVSRISVPTDTGYVASGEARLFYRTIGEGEPIVVLHGGPGMEHSYLLPGMEPLARDHRLVFYDQRGSGRSAAPLDSTSITLEKFLEDLDRMRRMLGEERVTLLGHSWGGLLAMLYASRNPDRVGSLILMSTIEPGQRYRTEMAARQRERRTTADSAEIADLVGSAAFRAREREAVNRLYRILFRSSFADPERADELVIDYTERTARAAGTLPELLLGGLDPFDFWNRLESVESPTLVIHGAEDPIPAAMAREIVARLPRARFVLLQDAGHFPFVETPDPLFAAIRRYLEDEVEEGDGSEAAR